MSRTHPAPDPAGDDRSDAAVDPATGRAPDDVRNSNLDLAGGMGVSSEREGHAGPGQHGTDGVRYTGPTETPGDAPPEQSAGGEEPSNTATMGSKAGYPSADPRSGEKPYDPQGATPS